MNYIEIILIIILIASFIFGAKRGFVLSLMQLFGVLMIFILIRQLGGVMATQIHARLGIGQTIATILTYILILIVVMVLVRLVAYLIKKFLQLVMLGWVDRLLGGLLGVLFGFLIISIVVLILELTSIGSALGEVRNNSRIYSTAKVMSNTLRINVIELMPGSSGSLPKHQDAV